ncbi:hypothetical protein [Vreelandella lionensis]|uniref:hypothetical protein n=1 Tax=Vreelandella lionensis TaxID=1144478 RepID=UPI001374839A|nr:hypothetical protein [Halomonas lionensis]
MHQDTRRIRQRYAAINLDDYEAKLIDALVDYTGMSKATLLRQFGAERSARNTRR